MYVEKNILWGQSARVFYLMLAAVILLLVNLGIPELWTQEHRWADIAFGMMYRHDYLHPFIMNSPYYDKPLLSYWLVVLLPYRDWETRIS